MDQVPGVVRLDNVGKGRHRRSIPAGHENAVEILIGFAALETGTSGKVIRMNRVVLAVGKRRSRRTVAMSLGSVTLPAFHFLEKFPAMKNAFNRYRCFCGNVDRRARFLGLPARRK